MKRFNNFLYVMNKDTAQPSHSLLRTVSLAKNSQASLTLLRVIPKLSLSNTISELGLSSAEIEQKAMAREEENLLQIIAALDKDVHIKAIVKVGKIYYESIRLVQSENFDILFKLADKASWLNHLIGSDDMHLLRNCPCPVWLLKKDENLNYKNILAAVDFDSKDENTCNDELNNTIMSLGCSIALAEFSTMHVAKVYNASDAGFVSLWVNDPAKVEKEVLDSEFRNSRYKMDLLVDTLKQQIGDESFNFLLLRSHLIQGTPSEELPKIAKKVTADLVIMGTIARTGIAGLLIGNTAENVLNQLNCSVLAIKPKDFISPIS